MESIDRLRERINAGEGAQYKPLLTIAEAARRELSSARNARQYSARYLDDLLTANKEKVQAEIDRLHRADATSAEAQMNTVKAKYDRPALTLDEIQLKALEMQEFKDKLKTMADDSVEELPATLAVDEDPAKVVAIGAELRARGFSDLADQVWRDLPRYEEPWLLDSDYQAAARTHREAKDQVGASYIVFDGPDGATELLDTSDFVV